LTRAEWVAWFERLIDVAENTESSKVRLYAGDVVRTMHRLYPVDVARQDAARSPAIFAAAVAKAAEEHREERSRRS